MIYHQQRYARALEQLVTPGIRWLDVGSGRRLHGGWGGISQQELAKRPAVLMGCDVVADHLAQNPFLTDYRVCRAENLPFPAASFDLVTANMVLEHLETPLAVFREIARVLAPGGMFLAVTPNRWHPVVLSASVFLHRRVRSLFAHWREGRDLEHIFPTHYACNTVRTVSLLAEQVGLVGLVEPFQSTPFARGWLGKLEAAQHWANNLFISLTRQTSVSAHHA